MLNTLTRFGFPHYVTCPMDLVVYVPARFYLNVRNWCESHREIGTRVTVLIDEL